MLDESLIFHKTESGAREMATPALGLPPKLRRALILVDGEKAVAQLSPLFRPGEVDTILVELQEKGLVTLAGGALAPVGPESPRADRGPGTGVIGEGNFREIRQRAMHEISHRLGPNGDALAIRVERCKTPEELRVALREAETILSSFLGAEYGRSFAQKIGRDLL